MADLVACGSCGGAPPKSCGGGPVRNKTHVLAQQFSSKENIQVEGKSNIQTKVVTTPVRRGRARPDLRAHPARALPWVRSSGRKLGRPKGLPGRLHGSTARRTEIQHFLELGPSGALTVSFCTNLVGTLNGVHQESSGLRPASITRSFASGSQVCYCDGQPLDGHRGYGRSPGRGARLGAWRPPPGRARRSARPDRGGRSAAGVAPCAPCSSRAGVEACRVPDSFRHARPQLCEPADGVGA